MIFDNETQFQKACNEYLNKRSIKFSHIEKGRSKNPTHRGGEPDLMIRPGNSKFFYVELKMPNKKLSKVQQEFKDGCFDNKDVFYMCDNWEWFLDIIEKEC